MEVEVNRIHSHLDVFGFLVCILVFISFFSRAFLYDESETIHDEVSKTREKETER